MGCTSSSARLSSPTGALLDARPSTAPSNYLIPTSSAIPAPCSTPSLHPPLVVQAEGPTEGPTSDATRLPVLRPTSAFLSRVPPRFRIASPSTRSRPPRPPALHPSFLAETDLNRRRFAHASRSNAQIPRIQNVTPDSDHASFQSLSLEST